MPLTLSVYKGGIFLSMSMYFVVYSAAVQRYSLLFNNRIHNRIFNRDDDVSKMTITQYCVTIHLILFWSWWLHQLVSQSLHNKDYIYHLYWVNFPEQQPRHEAHAHK